MALYHLHCDIIGRSGGRSATAAAAYRATCKIEDRTTGEKFDFTRKEKAVFSEILTNGNAPEWATDRAELWNSVEEKENRKNSQFCRSFDVALMKEFDLKTNIEILEKWVKLNYVSRGLVADISIHAPHEENGKSNDNIHAHILIPTRKMNSQGWTEKDRDANDRDFLKRVRTSWAEIVNEEFKSRGMSERIDERTLEEQGIIDREPQQHQGAKATAMERKGQKPDRKKKRPTQNVEIFVSDEEIKTALEQDPEFKLLQAELQKAIAEKRKNEKSLDEIELEKAENFIKKMTPKEWADFIKYEDKTNVYRFEAWGKFAQIRYVGEQNSRIEFIKQNIEPITKYFAEEFQKRKNELDFHDRQKPTLAESKGIANFLYLWTSADGKQFKKYDDYKSHTERRVRDWKIDRKPIYDRAVQAQEEYKDAKNKDFDKVYMNSQRHQKLWDKIKDGAKKIYNESPLFAPGRAVVKAVEKLRPQKTAELEQWRADRRANRSPSRDNDYYFGR